MTTYFVSRHPGARAWAADEGLHVDQVIAHLDPASVNPGDTVIGSLPVNLAAEVCARDARYLHLTLQVPQELRGKERSADQMRNLDAHIEPFVILRPDADAAASERP